jgi:hypothetical protein
MEENVPRRLARFNRNQNTGQEQGNNYSYQENQPQIENPRRSQMEEKQYYANQPQGLPTMDYKDINLEADKKNMEELQKIREKNLVEKLALEEIEKFKIQNKRMPNSKEEEQIAENLFKQLKDSPSDPNSAPKGSSRRERRRNRGENSEGLNSGALAVESEQPVSQNEPISNQPASEVTNVKDLFGEDEDAKKSTAGEKDEFDISLGDMDSNSSENTVAEENSDLGEMDKFSLEDSAICPNCKKSTEKILYCAKCGTAFCKNCAKSQGTEKLCPKCGTKIRL